MAGTGPFGQVPGVVGLPSPSADLGAVLPGLAPATSQASQDVMAKLRGELSPGTINSIQDTAARFGVTSGMPGFSPGSLAGNRGLRDIGLTAEAQTQQGLQDYNALTQNVSNTQTVRPETQIALAEQNAVNAAAPNPQAAQSYAESLFNKYLNQIHGGVGGQGRPPIRQASGGVAPAPYGGAGGSGDYVADYFTKTGAYPGAGDVQHGTNIYGATPWDEKLNQDFFGDGMSPMDPFGVSLGAVYNNGAGNAGTITPLSQEQWTTGTGNTDVPFDYQFGDY